ncbi:MFS transporter [Amycolatopsis pigmentata]|uniref:MFS transporter n=1 Tax=Amycolatopsis pigmentata TaxID=450801 RepID=A0ABW5FMQ2_9PSEU
MGDRLGARRVMITCDAIMLVVAVALAVSSSWIGTPALLLPAVAFVNGATDAFYLPSSGSMPRRLVAGDQLVRALALRQSGSQVVAIAGGPLGGVLVAYAGLSGTAWADALTFAVVLVVLVRIRTRGAAALPGQRKNVLLEAADGVRLAFRTAGLGTALLLVAAAAGLILPFGSILVPLLARDRAWGAGLAGLLLGAQSAGTIVSTLVVSTRGAGSRPGLMAVGALLVVGTGQVTVALAKPVGFALAGAFVAGVGTGVFASHLSPILLSAAPEAYLARIQALLTVVQSCALLLTNNALGSLAHALGPVGAVMISAAVLAGCAVAGFASASLRRLTTFTVTLGPSRPNRAVIAGENPGHGVAESENPPGGPRPD